MPLEIPGKHHLASGRRLVVGPALFSGLLLGDWNFSEPPRTGPQSLLVPHSQSNNSAHQPLWHHPDAKSRPAEMVLIMPVSGTHQNLTTLFIRAVPAGKGAISVQSSGLMPCDAANPLQDSCLPGARVLRADEPSVQEGMHEGGPEGWSSFLLSRVHNCAEVGD